MEAGRSVANRVLVEFRLGLSNLTKSHRQPSLDQQTACRRLVAGLMRRIRIWIVSRYGRPGWAGSKAGAGREQDGSRTGAGREQNWRWTLRPADLPAGLADPHSEPLVYFCFSGGAGKKETGRSFVPYSAHCSSPNYLPTTTLDFNYYFDIIEIRRLYKRIISIQINHVRCGHRIIWIPTWRVCVVLDGFGG